MIKYSNYRLTISWTLLTAVFVNFSIIAYIDKAKYSQTFVGVPIVGTLAAIFTTLSVIFFLNAIKDIIKETISREILIQEEDAAIRKKEDEVSQND